METQNKWGTFYGRELLISELSHQHLSNILWYYEIIIKGRVTPLIQAELDKRFGGIRLPYRPLHSFTFEVNELLEMGYITNTQCSDVVVDGRWVGRLEYS